jgi:hypothetical protein
MVYITHIRLCGGTGLQHITHVRWEETFTGRSNTLTRARMVRHICEGNDVWVRGNDRDAKVAVVTANPAFIRTLADGQETSNLLSLPRF